MHSHAAHNESHKTMFTYAILPLWRLLHAASTRRWPGPQVQGTAVAGGDCLRGFCRCPYRSSRLGIGFIRGRTIRIPLTIQSLVTTLAVGAPLSSIDTTPLHDKVALPTMAVEEWAFLPVALDADNNADNNAMVTAA